ncbi:hypothetical protein [Heyndrickxia faecalis]|nr:hypothetical protein [Heyndrickxia faecalis]MBQ4911282.1 hypothetical protein [Heyndrickxia faecalis]
MKTDQELFANQKTWLNPRPVRFAAPVYAAVRHARYPSPVGEVFYV